MEMFPLLFLSNSCKFNKQSQAFSRQQHSPSRSSTIEITTRNDTYKMVSLNTALALPVKCKALACTQSQQSFTTFLTVAGSVSIRQPCWQCTSLTKAEARTKFCCNYGRNSRNKLRHPQLVVLIAIEVPVSLRLVQQESRMPYVICRRMSEFSWNPSSFLATDLFQGLKPFEEQCCKRT